MPALPYVDRLERAAAHRTSHASASDALADQWLLAGYQDDEFGQLLAHLGQPRQRDARAPPLELEPLDAFGTDRALIAQSGPGRSTWSATAPGRPACRPWQHRMRPGQADSHYGEQLDEPIPMLGDISPHKAAKTAKGRAKIASRLKFLENRTSSQQDPGDAMADYDLTWLWQELRVADLRK